MKKVSNNTKRNKERRKTGFQFRELPIAVCSDEAAKSYVRVGALRIEILLRKLHEEFLREDTTIGVRQGLWGSSWGDFEPPPSALQLTDNHRIPASFC